MKLLAAILATDLLFVLSLALHELGHAVAAWALHLRVLRVVAGSGPLLLRIRLFEVRLLPILGTTEIAGGLPAAPFRARVLVALAGPAASALTAGGFLLLANAFQAFAAPLRTMAVANVALAAFNLVPVPPLDGWQAIEAVLDRAGWLRFTTSQRESVYRTGLVLILVATAAFFAARFGG
jgi:membrane-associated protease RseP (regulator of RpoE activity)